MSQSDVRSIDSLADLHRAVIHLSEKLMQQGHQLSGIANRVDQHFSQEVPAYWRSQLRKSEQELSEALDRLSRKQATIRPGNPVPATEEKKQVAYWKSRVRLCHQKVSRARNVAVEIQQECEKMKGPLADLMELSEVGLPTAATRLAGLIERLQAYQNNAGPDVGRG